MFIALTVPDTSECTDPTPSGKGKGGQCPTGEIQQGVLRYQLHQPTKGQAHAETAYEHLREQHPCTKHEGRHQHQGRPED